MSPAERLARAVLSETQVGASEQQRRHLVSAVQLGVLDHVGRVADDARDEDAIGRTLGSVLKYAEDQDVVRAVGLSQLIAGSR